MKEIVVGVFATRGKSILMQLLVKIARDMHIVIGRNCLPKHHHTSKFQWSPANAPEHLAEVHGLVKVLQG